MSSGPGKYDKETTLVRELTQAQAVVLVVLDGQLGSGFSVQTSDAFPPGLLADLLENTAREIRMTA